MITEFKGFGILFFAFFLGIISPAAFAEDDNDNHWLVDASTGCRIWNGVIESGESATWDGDCVNGYAAGEGTLNWFINGEPNGSYYGERSKGKAHGYGVNEWLSGDRYEGFWKDDHFHGRGTYAWSSGLAYQGEWLDNRRHGEGVLLFPNGTRFEGTFRKGRAFAGVYITEDGARYIADIDGDAIGPGERLFSEADRRAVRTIGNRICRPDAYFFNWIDATLTGFVEGVSEERIKIRIAGTGSVPFPTTYKGISVYQGAIIWDDTDNWQSCPFDE